VPFVSKQQRKFMWATKPGLAEEWEKKDSQKKTEKKRKRKAKK
jgi:hypothetical protein